MFKLRFTTIAIAIAILFICLLSFVGISNAIEIEKLEPYSGSYEEYDYGYYHTACIETDEPFYTISWYLDGTYVGYTAGDNVTTTAYFNFFGMGSIAGKKHQISATVYSLENDDGNHEEVSDSYEMLVFTPAYIALCQDNGVCGHAELKRQYFDGAQIAVDYYAYAEKSTSRGRTFVYTIMTHEMGNLHTEKKHPADEFLNPIPQRIGPNHGTYSHSDTIGFDVEVDDAGRLAEDYTSEAYIRLVVNGDQDTYYVPNTEYFYENEAPFNDTD